MMTTSEPIDPRNPYRITGVETPRRRSALHVGLWVVQVLLALLFLWGGGMKLVLPLEKLAGPVPLPGLFLRFIGVAEVLGGLGLLLPGLLRIKPILTSWAAAGLVIIMIGAVVITLAGGVGVGLALIPPVTGLPGGVRRLRPLAARAAELQDHPGSKFCLALVKRRLL